MTLPGAETGAATGIVAGPPSRREPAVSVIVPVFDLEGYVDRCLHSLSAQSWRDFEVLIVDDGSSDATLARCRSHAETDPRLRVFSKCNEGQGVARNFALDRARGRHVAFVDGDDWLAPHALEHAVSLIERTQADFVNFGLHFVGLDGRVRARFGGWRQRELRGDAIVRAAMLDDQVLTSPCNKLYRRDLLERHHIRFPASRGCEDLYFSRVLALHSQRAAFTDEVLYFALVRPGSTTRGARPELLQEAGRVIEAERSYFASQGRLAPLITEFRAHVVKLFSHLLVLAAVRVDSVEDFERCVRSARASGYPDYAVMPSVLRCLPWRNRLLAVASLWPRSLRSTLRLARRLGWAPY